MPPARGIADSSLDCHWENTPKGSTLDELSWAPKVAGRHRRVRRTFRETEPLLLTLLNEGARAAPVAKPGKRKQKHPLTADNHKKQRLGSPEIPPRT